jgi:hypothetical protein
MQDNIMKKILLATMTLLLLAACNQPSTNTTSSSTDTAVSTAFRPANVDEQVKYSRAFNAVIWGMPAVNSELMHENLLQAKGDYNQVVYWSGLINDKNQTLTPNPDVIYINPFYDTRKGPVVLEIPPAEGISSLTGSLDDAWQTAIEDIGPAGVDKGKGGKYLILPPGFKGKIPSGYISMPSSVYTGYAILRSNRTNGSKEDIARAVDYGKKIKIYPYSQAENPPRTIFVDLLQTAFGNTIPYDIHFFESLNSFVQREPWLTRDKAMIDQLKTIGIEKAKAFNPDARTKEILNAAIADAHIWIDGIYASIFNPPFYEGTHWALPSKADLVKEIMNNFADSNSYPLDSRAATYSIGYFSAKHLGGGQFYLMTIVDNTSKPLDGAKTYKLHLPANVPVKLYWSVTMYDRQTHALVQGVPTFSRASTTPGLQKNADGSVDIYFGAKAPAGKESNWVPSDPKRGFELLARFYGPEKAFFDKIWKMGDVEEVNQ